MVARVQQGMVARVLQGRVAGAQLAIRALQGRAAEAGAQLAARVPPRERAAGALAEAQGGAGARARGEAGVPKGAQEGAEAQGEAGVLLEGAGGAQEGAGVLPLEEEVVGITETGTGIRRLLLASVWVSLDCTQILLPVI